MAAPIRITAGFHAISLRGVPIGIPLPCALYVPVGERLVLFRNSGDLVSADRLRDLARRRVTRVFVRQDDRRALQEAHWEVLCTPGVDVQTRVRTLKNLGRTELRAARFLSPTATADRALQFTEKASLPFALDLLPFSAMSREFAKDGAAYEHALHVSAYSMAIAAKLYPGDQRRIALAGAAGLIHDIGEKRASIEIWRSKPTLSDHDLLLMRRHPEYGFDLLSLIPGIPEEVSRAVLEHHEHYDGAGYPLNRRGENINEMSQIVAIADVFDGLTGKRPYQKPHTVDEAREVMARMQPGRFAPNVYRAFTTEI